MTLMPTWRTLLTAGLTLTACTIMLPPADADPQPDDPGYGEFTSLLLTLRKVPDVFAEAFRPYRFRVPRRADCLICQARPTPTTPEELDVALHQALARLGDG